MLKKITFLLRKLIVPFLIFFVVLLIALFIWGRGIQFDDRFAPVIYAASGEVLSASVSSDQQWRIQCEGEVPDKLKIAIRLFEDEYFFKHIGVNPISIGKAMVKNYKAGRVRRGGSTLTMQLARIYYRNRKRSYSQKVKEIFLAMAIELNYSKDEIMNKYCQYAPFGGNIIGYCAASHKYFNKSPELLSWSESVILAVLPNAPSDVFPGKGQERLNRKRNYLLKKLLNNYYIDSISYRLSLLEEIPTNSFPFDNLTPHILTDYKNNEGIGNNHSSIDFSLQKSTVEVVDKYHKRYVANGIDNLAVLIIRNDGKIISYVSNTKCRTVDCGTDVDMIHSFRSPGSILKPFLYGLSMDKGYITNTSLLLDVPSFYNGFSPKNFDRKFRGIVPAEDALTMSLNVPAVNLLSKYGIDAFINNLQAAGYESTKNDANYYGLSLILGGSEVSMLEVGQSYMNMVRTAMGKEAIIPIVSNQSKVVLANDYPMSRGASWMMLNMLSGVNRPSSRDGWQYFVNKKKISWKTGTSFGYRDAWSVGVTKDYTVVVWVGNADGEGKKGLTGIKKAAPVLFSVFDLLPNSTEVEMSYKDLKYHNICKISGYSATDNCEEKERVMVPISSHHIPMCAYHKPYAMDETGVFRVNSSCEEFQHHTTKTFFVLNPILNSYHQKYTGIDYSIPPIMDHCKEDDYKLDIIYPLDHSTILIPKDINKFQQELICNATTTSGESLFWFLDELYLGETTDSHKVKFTTNVGIHHITIVSKSGDTKTHEFEVIE